ncbi:LANO_0D04654g1_1 [Lachancea nothofagi CBS 11611]|uniref:LANO_0D04654g1_1 n=1 Tax=Lachancea nothofagi CBS 11611 TaxID=1266666 RepID=A0A1G4JGR7_9SACH|nr:LANO_0D04654g1_1 [Lachancea nothofagi CBS 11611]
MTIDPVKYLKSICSVRETTSQVFQYACKNHGGNHFDLELSQMAPVADFLCSIIERDYGTNYVQIPSHGRWQHLNYGSQPRVESLIQQWTEAGVDKIEIARKLIDLFVLSVLVDAGAGNVWKYTIPGSANDTQQQVGRSEGLAVASYYMFAEGQFSSDPQDSFKVCGSALEGFSLQDFAKGFQISNANPMDGFEGRLQLIQRLGRALNSNADIFGPEGRPGGIVDYLYGLAKKTSGGECVIDLEDVWDALMAGLTSIWPAGRTVVNGEPLGDVWSLDTKADAVSSGVATAPENVPTDLVTFHKLTQWLCYSLLVPLEQYGHQFTITNKQLQTGLPEYRNGGLFYDFGVLKLKPEALERGLKLSVKLQKPNTTLPTFEPQDGAIVEWRCLTIGLLDYLLPIVNEKLGYQLSLPQLIEAGSWKAGREIAAKLRPETNGPPIDLHSDGTVF